MRVRPALLLLCFALLPALAAPLIGVFQRPASAAQEFGEPIPGLTRAEEELHIRGRRLFRWELWRPDRIVSGFNENECSKCHLEPQFGGSNVDSKTYAAFMPNSNHITGWTPFHRRQRDENRRFVAVPPPSGAEIRRAPALYGLGLLEAVPTSSIVSAEDPSDNDGDGISGRALRVGSTIGRFGWRGDAPSIEAITINAFKAELGVNVEPYDRDDFAGLSIQQIRAVAFYCRTLSPPPAHSSSSAPLRRGRAVFSEIGCAKCHSPRLTTGPSTIAALANRTIEPYTDLLLHDVLDARSRPGQSEPVTSGEFRTPALWGIGSFDGPFWHDGSAKTLSEAILKHGGESESSRNRFRSISEADRKALLDFLKSL